MLAQTVNILGQRIPGLWTTLGFALLTLGLLLITLGWRRGRSAVRVLTSAPAFLVPAALAVATALWLDAGRRSGGLIENPWHSRGGSGDGQVWLLVVVVAVAIAGQIGLLEARARGRKAHSDAFLRGITDHFLTVGLAQLVLCLGLYGVSEALHPRGWMNLAYMAPSLVLAPLPGIASRYPRQPTKALIETLRFSYGNLGDVARPVILQSVLLASLFYAYAQVTHDRFSLAMPLGPGNSVLSYNSFPFGGIKTWPVLSTFMAMVSGFASAAFLTWHWSGVRNGYRSEDPEPAALSPKAPPATPEGAEEPRRARSD